jgi:hypothetical protein
MGCGGTWIRGGSSMCCSWPWRMSGDPLTSSADEAAESSLGLHVGSSAPWEDENAMPGPACWLGPAVWAEEKTGLVQAGQVVKGWRRNCSGDCWSGSFSWGGDPRGVTVRLHKANHHCRCGRAGPCQTGEPPACATQQSMVTRIN